MTAETVLILALSLLSAALLMILLFKRRREPENRSDDAFLRMGRRLEQLDRMARQMDDMSRVFNSPRLRGGLGETLLEDLIRNRLPKDSYAFQYGFAGGQRADAVIRMGSYKVAVDAKFPLEQMQALNESADGKIPRSVEKIFLNHGKSIAEKYILPREGTLPFALMYIPSENLYYRVFIAGGSALQEDLLNMGILPVSPSTLFSYLQTVLYGFKGFSFSSKSREMMQLIGQLRKDFNLFSRQMRTAGTHLKNFQKSWDEGIRGLDALENNIRRLDE